MSDLFPLKKILMDCYLPCNHYSSVMNCIHQHSWGALWDLGGGRRKRRRFHKKISNYLTDATHILCNMQILLCPLLHSHMCGQYFFAIQLVRHKKIYKTFFLNENWMSYKDRLKVQRNQVVYKFFLIKWELLIHQSASNTVYDLKLFCSIWLVPVNLYDHTDPYFVQKYRRDMKIPFFA